MNNLIRRVCYETLFDVMFSIHGICQMISMQSSARGFFFLISADSPYSGILSLGTKLLEFQRRLVAELARANEFSGADSALKPRLEKAEFQCFNVLSTLERF